MRLQQPTLFCQLIDTLTDRSLVRLLQNSLQLTISNGTLTDNNSLLLLSAMALSQTTTAYCYYQHTDTSTSYTGHANGSLHEKITPNLFEYKPESRQHLHSTSQTLCSATDCFELLFWLMCAPLNGFGECHSISVHREYTKNLSMYVCVGSCPPTDTLVTSFLWLVPRRI